MKLDPYVLGRQLLSLDLDSVSLSELAVLDYVCAEMRELVDKEFKDRGE